MMMSRCRCRCRRPGRCPCIACMSTSMHYCELVHNDTRGKVEQRQVKHRCYAAAMLNQDSELALSLD